jgi:Ser/Thr protein kinase RdoA (MazF antagonist)
MMPKSRTQAPPERNGLWDARLGWAEAALEQYGLRDAQSVLLKEGSDQRKLIFRVDSPTQGRFLLRIYKLFRHSENLMPELLWLQALRREMPLSVPEPIPASDGSLVTHVSRARGSEARRCVLLRWLPGGRKKADMNRANLSLAGSQVARLHRHCEQYGVPEGLVFPHEWGWDWVFGEAAPLWSKGESVYSPNEMDVFRATAERIRKDLQDLGAGSDVFGIIHRDLHPNNLLFHDGKAYVIDFEVCGWGYYLFDMAVALSSLENRAPLQAAFIEGYRRERPLPESHWSYLQTFVAMRLVQRVNMVLRWEDPAQRQWGPSVLSNSAKWLEEFPASKKGRARRLGFDSRWWRKAFPE